MSNDEDQKISNGSLEKIDHIRSLVEENLRYTKTIHQFTPKDMEKQKTEMAHALKELLDYTKANYALLEKIMRWIFWQKVFSVLKILIIVIPIILGIIFLPPLLSEVFGSYMELFSEFQNINEAVKSIQ